MNVQKTCRRLFESRHGQTRDSRKPGKCFLNTFVSDLNFLNLQLVKKACPLLKFRGIVQPAPQPAHRQPMGHSRKFQAQFLQPGTNLFVHCCISLLTLNLFCFFIQSVKLGSVTYRELDNTADYLPVRRRVEEIIQQAEFPTHTFSDNKHVSQTIK